MKKLMVIAAVAALALTACGKTAAVRDPDAGAAPTNTLRVKAHEYMFDVSGAAKTGVLSLEFANTGKELHHGIVGRIDKGKTVEDVKDLITKDQGQGEPPTWFHDDPIDSGLVGPGRSQTLSFPAKDAGTYVLVCMMSAPDGAPHVAKGMIASFEVAGSSEAAAPKADATVTMSEYAFSKPVVAAGLRTLAMKNAGKENHDFAIVKMAAGKKLADIDVWFEGGAKGPSPTTFYGGSHDFEPGITVTFTANLDAGTYLMVCTQETEGGKNHGDDLGMVTEFTVA